MPDDLDKVLEAMSARAAGPVPREPTTMKEFQKVIDSTPLFMRETPVDGGESDVMDALKSLIFEGDPDEVALNFKNHGNELYAQKSYRDAITSYTSAIDAKPTSTTLQITCHNNRAACNLSLKNYGEVLKDVKAVITLTSNPEDIPPKTWYRGAMSLIALEKWVEARDCVERGRVSKGEDEAGKRKVWEELEKIVNAGERRVEERKERERRDKVGKEALRRAVASRGLVILNTSEPPDNPTPTHFDPTDIPTLPLYTPPTSTNPTPTKWYPPSPTHPLIFPVFLLYPQHNTSDLVTHFHEDTSFDDQLGVIFPTDAADQIKWSEWDVKHEYHLGNLAVYAETSQRRLLKIGKEITLREVVLKARKEVEGEQPDGIVLRDGLMSFVVLVKGREEREWIDNFKKVRDGSR